MCPQQNSNEAFLLLLFVPIPEPLSNRHMLTPPDIQWYWSTAATSSLTYQSGSDVNVRGNFLNNGVLPNTQDTNYRAISDNWPAFGFGMISERDVLIT